MNKYIQYFTEEELVGISLPPKFTFPFFYTPHPLAVLASEKLQAFLTNQRHLTHNFGLDESQPGMVIGKMFGVLVVKDKQDKIGFLWAFSGKLAGTNQHDQFVPPVFDMLTENSFFLQEETLLNAMNRAIEDIESNPNYLSLKQQLMEQNLESKNAIASCKQRLKENKAQRQAIRIAKKAVLTSLEFALLEEELIKQSLADKRSLLQLTNYWKQSIIETKKVLDTYEEKIKFLKKERKEKSAALQQQLFEQYTFLNQYKEKKSLGSIFSETVFGKPPAAAGECATPKLLQFAFSNEYSPLAMAEFWWGASPKSEIRKHQQFYPACRGKCEPILKHMLKGMEQDENPFLKNDEIARDLKIVFEDEHLAVVDKPANLLSVPGIHLQDSVFTRLKEKWINVEPLIVHRLDMATSGLLLIAKTKAAHTNLQKQFLRKTVRKRYSAILSQKIIREEGIIELPLMGDITDRPKQMVCKENGKPAITLWKKISVLDYKTKVHFWPITGRTHQLRVHAAHIDGLNAPIVGDDLYGTPAERLFLQAAEIQFIHPATKQEMRFIIPEEF